MELRRIAAIVLGVGIVATWLASVVTTQAPTADQYWPQWRGPHATGVSNHADPPVEWSETKNIRWKVEIPGRGSASPVVWGDRLFLLTAVPGGVSTRRAHAPRGARPAARAAPVHGPGDRPRTGQVVWERTAREEQPHEASHQDNGTWASSSAITDGEHVIAYFESRGLYAYDMNGTPVWEKDLGDKQMRNEFGEGSTPALHGNRSSSSGITRAQSFIVALDKRTGQGALARRARRDRHLGHAARRRARRPRAGGRRPAMNQVCAATTSRPATWSGTRRARR